MHNHALPSPPISELPFRDSLTGAYSRTVFDARLQEEVDRSRRYGHVFSLCLFDLDHFKSINDAYGHLRGDQVLAELAKRVLTIMRSSDLFFRYGGDEFVLLLPNTAKEGAVVLAERILDSVRDVPFAGQPPLALTLSMGIAAFPEDATAVDALFAAADRRSYSAKRQGRARVVSTDVAEQPTLHIDPHARLVERDNALAELQDFLDRLLVERRGVLRVVGLPGAGRTRFLHEVMTAARLRSFQMLMLDALPHQHNDPFGSLRASGWLAGLPDSVGVDAVAVAVCQRLTAQPNHALLIAVDNVPNLDHATLALLRQLLSNRSLPALAIVYTTTPTDLRMVGPRDLPLQATVAIQAFSLNALQVWVRSILHSEPAPAFLEWLYVTTSGLPARVAATLSELVTNGGLLPTMDGSWALSPEYRVATQGQLPACQLATPVHNLPAMLTNFVGRESERKQVTSLVTQQRLVTLVGPGGIGKTRLALQSAAELLHDFNDGVRFVELASLRTPELVLPTVAQVVDVAEVPGEPLISTLKRALYAKQQLLVLDNFEHVVDAAPSIAELLTACPGINVLVTSRAPLRLDSEQVYAVPPLPVPDLGAPLSLADWQQSASVALFAARAQDVQYDFTLTVDNTPTVAELCYRLDGLPLAIELAAARCYELSPADMLTHLRSRLNLLSEGPRDLPTRQQTLRGAIAWSYELLSEPEQQLFARLGVFVGSWPLEAVNALYVTDTIDECSSDTEQLAQLTPVPELLDALVEKSLVRRLEDVKAELRFVMLETIHEYAVEQLASSGEDELIHERHGTYYLALAETAEPLLTSGDQHIWMERLEREHSNMRALLDWACTHGRAIRAARLAGALWRFWYVRAHVREGRRWLEFALEQLDQARSNAPAVDPEWLAVRAKALGAAGALASIQSDYVTARRLLVESVTLQRTLNHPAQLASALNTLGIVAAFQCDYPLAKANYQESLELRQTIGDMAGMASSITNLGELALVQGHFAEAAPLLERGLKLWREIGNTQGVVVTLLNLGTLVLDQGDITRSQHLFNEALTLSQQLGDTGHTAFSLHNLGIAAIDQGNYGEAQRLLFDALRLHQETGDTEGLVSSVEGLADLAAINGQVLRAARLYAAMGSLRESIDAPLQPIAQLRHDRIRSATCASFDQTLFAAAWDAGRSLTLQQAIDLAMEDAN